tara:strand:+ start:204 stop:851 length:648 start_codon:yes stop_codon:yes gene_type:complete
MVDTLAPKKIYKQRDLDKSLTPSPVTEAIMTPGKNIMATAPKQEATPALVNMEQPDYLVDSTLIAAQTLEKSAPMTAERNQTIKSSAETTDDKQTGNVVAKDVPQGLGARPITYAAEGLTDATIDGPLVVGEKGPEMIIPTGKGKFTVINNEALQGLMSRLGDKESATMIVAQAPKYSDEEMEILRDKFFEGPASDFQSLDQYLNSQRAREDLST